MTAYDEEQEQELEALESIYPEELEILSREKPLSFQIAVKSQVAAVQLSPFLGGLDF